MSNNLLNTKPTKTQRMFFGESHGIQEFVDTPYPEFIKFQEQQREQDWSYDEFSLKLDAAQLNNANSAVRHIFTSNLQSQIFADTMQGRGPAWLLPYVSDSSLEAAFIEWARSEIIHSKSYSYMLTSMYANPRIILDMIGQKPEVFKRFSACIKAYDRFFENPTKKNLVLLIAAINILEGLSFYASFACNFAFAQMGLFESVSKYLQSISKDEHLHLGLTVKIIKNWRDGKDGPEWKALWNECKPLVRQMWIDSLEEEKAWSKYLFQYGTPTANLNEQLLNDTNEYYANKRMKSIGIMKVSNLNKDPIPWMQSQYLTSKSVQNAPQEVSINAYVKNRIEKIKDLSDLARL